MGCSHEREIFEFPGHKLPSEPFSEQDIAKLHSEAFRDLEGAVCDLDRMGEITQNLIMNCATGEDSLHDLELATFAIGLLAKMTKEFKAQCLPSLAR